MGLESGFNSTAQAKTTSAYGLGQFTNDTWKRAVKYYNKKGGGNMREKEQKSEDKPLLVINYQRWNVICWTIMWVFLLSISVWGLITNSVFDYETGFDAWVVEISLILAVTFCPYLIFDMWVTKDFRLYKDKIIKQHRLRLLRDKEIFYKEAGLAVFPKLKFPINITVYKKKMHPLLRTIKGIYVCCFLADYNDIEKLKVILGEQFQELLTKNKKQGGRK